ncbi:hypothetical protein LCGC14_0663360 [marine sediment metagenome]|uniref:Uncharacterized protein n=1 Tax=marine sediment metagenome TaxID=412755 RepID=A0A0F9QSZ2_9ZZZZ
MDLILDYYKDWDSEKTPVMMIFEGLDGFTENIQAMDEKKLAYLRKKYKKSSD